MRYCSSPLSLTLCLLSPACPGPDSFQERKSILEPHLGGAGARAERYQPSQKFQGKNEEEREGAVGVGSPVREVVKNAQDKV